MSNTERQLISEKIKFELAWDALEALGISAVEVEFSGQGDSGEITNVTPMPADVPVDAMTMDERTDAYEKAASAFNTQCMALDQATVELETGNRVKLAKLIEELTDTFIANHEDWWNDDGGYGKATWYVAKGDDDNTPARSIAVEINVRIVNTDYYIHYHNRHGQSTNMKTYLCSYYRRDDPVMHYFRCQADNADHASEQLINAEPEAMPAIRVEEVA